MVVNVEYLYNISDTPVHSTTTLPMKRVKPYIFVVILFIYFCIVSIIPTTTAQFRCHVYVVSNV